MGSKQSDHKTAKQEPSLKWLDQIIFQRCIFAVSADFSWPAGVTLPFLDPFLPPFPAPLPGWPQSGQCRGSSANDWFAAVATGLNCFNFLSSTAWDSPSPKKSDQMTADMARWYFNRLPHKGPLGPTEVHAWCHWCRSSSLWGHLPGPRNVSANLLLRKSLRKALRKIYVYQMSLSGKFIMFIYGYIMFIAFWWVEISSAVTTLLFSDSNLW